MKSQLQNKDRAKVAWSEEMAAAGVAGAQADGAGEWAHLERAHIVSQPLAGLHVRTHGAMFGAALRRRDGRELVGQAFRLVVAGPGSLTGRYPVGNTGGANVSAFEAMDLPADLQALFAPSTSASPRVS